MLTWLAQVEVSPIARCCGGGSCSCNIQGGLNVVVTGVGSLQDPFVVSADLAMVASDNTVFDVTVTGSGTIASPWLVSVAFAGTARLNDLPDVTVPTPTNGQVLAWNSSTSQWEAAAPTTAATGAVNHDTSLNGTGAVGAPLAVVPYATRYLATTASGVGLTDAGINQMVRRFVDATARASASPAPVLDSLSMLDTAPGKLDYWNGSAWGPLKDDIDMDAAANQVLVLSGAYANNLPLTMLVRNFTGTTDGSGVLTVIAPALLTGKSGILSATVQATGVVGYTHTLTPGTNYLAITARNVADGALLASQAIQGQVIAYVY